MLDELAKDMSDEQIQEAKGFFLKSTELEKEYRIGMGILGTSLLPTRLAFC